MPPVPLLVDQQARPTVVVDHQQIRIPVAVHIAAGDATAHLGELEDLAGRFGDFLKLPFAQVHEQLVGLMEGIGIVLQHQREKVVHPAVGDIEI